MRQRRVGTISMGVLLLTMGILLMYAQLNSIAALDIMIRWWPIVFLLLGGEIIAYTYLIKDDQQRVKYDFISILVIIFIVGSGIGLYSISEIGLMERGRAALVSQRYTLQIPEERVELDNKVEKIILESPLHTKLIVRTSEVSAVSIHGTSYVNADSQENAQKLLMEKIVTTRKIGDTVYMAFNTPVSGSDLGNNARITELTVFLPEDRQIEINSDYQLDLIIYDLKNNWDINGNGDVNLRIGSGLDLAVNAQVYNKSNLKGSINWQTTPEEENEGRERISGSAAFGKGTNKINIITRGDVEVSKQPD